MAKKEAEQSVLGPDVRKMEELRESLPVRLSEAELLERGRLLANQERLLAALREEAADRRKAFKESEEDIQAEIASLTQAIHSGQAEREVECESYCDRKEVYVVRLDTGEIIRKRPLTEKERQMPLAILEVQKGA